MKEIAIIDSGYESYASEQELFARHGYLLRINQNSLHQSDQERILFAGEAVGILVRGTRIDKTALEQLPALKVVVRYGVGYDNLDLTALKERGIRVANVQGYANHAVSDHAVALMFSCARDLEGNRKSPFGRPSRKEMFEFHDKILGIIGIGRIGSQFSRKASPLFRQTLACDPYQTDSFIRSSGAIKTNLPELLSKSHVISLHCNLTPETRYLLNGDRFSRMRNHPVIINTARGPVIREKDLLEALNKDMIHSAGLDVFEKEPPGEDQQKLMEHPRVVATPHIAWYSEYAMKTLQKNAAENMIALLSGQVVSDEL